MEHLEKRDYKKLLIFKDKYVSFLTSTATTRMFARFLKLNSLYQQKKMLDF